MQSSVTTVLAATFLSALVITTTVQPAIAAANCLSAAEAKAERVRIVQTELMVAGLKCTSRPELGLGQTYDRFVHRFTSVLVENAAVLSAYFERHYGTAYEHHQDKYIVGLADRISLISNRYRGFCEAVAAFGVALLDSGDNDAEARLDDPVFTEPGTRLCRSLAANPISSAALGTK